MKCLLFIDPGTACGFAVGYRNKDGHFTGFSGDWDLRRKKQDAWVMTPIKLKREVKGIYKIAEFDHVGYEANRRHLGTDAAHMHGALTAAIQEVCLELGISFEGVEVGTLKKFWTGKGNASKDEMIAAARQRGFEPATDNEADAIAGWHWLDAQFEASVSVTGPSVLSEQNSTHLKIIPSEAAE